MQSYDNPLSNVSGFVVGILMTRRSFITNIADVGVPFEILGDLKSEIWVD